MDSQIAAGEGPAIDECSICMESSEERGVLQCVRKINNLALQIKIALPFKAFHL
jgi:hypothetical protein